MRYSLRWLCRYLRLTSSPEELFCRLTETGTEVERVGSYGISDSRIVVAEILAWERHPNADRLRVCRVSTGSEERTIVCGATNFDRGDRAPLALPGAVLPGGRTIGPATIRGIRSEGMLCSLEELGLNGQGEGIWLLPKDWELGSPLSEWLPPDTLFDVEITPNRPDLLCYEGLAREAQAVGCGEFLPVECPEPCSGETPLDWSLELQALDACPFYGATLLEEVSVGPSPRWLQAFLWAIGRRPINNVVDVTNFVLWELGEPLHAFDADRLDGRILVRYAAPGEPFLGLDGRRYELDPSVLVIADGKGAQALAGILGGQESAIRPETKRVLLESAWFAPAVIRRAARLLGIHSDAAYRFERRVDPSNVLRARNRALQLLLDCSGAKLRHSPKVAGSPPTGPKPVLLGHDKVSSFLGLSLTRAEIEESLSKLGLIPLETHEDRSLWLPPSWRADLREEVDLLEEILRMAGTDRLAGRIPPGRMARTEADESFDRLERLRHALAARGWQECLCVPLRAAGPSTEDGLTVANPLSLQHVRLRSSLEEGLVEVASLNLSRGNRMLKLFELGRIFRRTPQGTVLEEERLGLLWAGETTRLHWSLPRREVDFFDLKGVMEWLVEEWRLCPVGQIKDVGPLLEARTGIATPAYFGELSLAEFLRSFPWRFFGSFEPLPAFPAVRRDVALVVPLAISHEEVYQALRSCSPPFLESLELFDCFVDPEGVRVPKGHKSLAYRLTYRAKDRTLTDEEVNALQRELLEKIQKRLPCTVRES
jgi:phenylalanyl-tRNA synthetase beta chain